MSDEQHTAEALDRFALVALQRDAARADLARVTAERDALLALLRKWEWSAVIDGFEGYCPECGRQQGEGHGITCELAQLIEGVWS